MTKWTDSRVARLKQMHAAGYSAQLIAADLGHGVTRNAVIGKLNRLEVPSPDQVVKVIPFRPSQRVRAKPKPKTTFGTARLLQIVHAPTLAHAAPSEHVTLFELENRHCRWPVSTCPGIEQLFCGDLSADLTDRLPYCEQHARLSRASMR